MEKCIKLLLAIIIVNNRKEMKILKNFKRHYTRREMEKILKNNGWTIDRQKGSHRIYTNNQGSHITIGTCNYNAMVFQRLAKENNMIL